MDWCSVYLTPQGLPKYIYLSPLLIFPTTSNGIRTKKNAQCESLRALLQYVEWDRFVTLTGAQAEWGLRYSIYYFPCFEFVQFGNIMTKEIATIKKLSPEEEHSFFGKQIKLVGVQPSSLF